MDIEKLGAFAGSIATPMAAAETARVGMPVMAPPPGAEVERLRALLKEAHAALVAAPIYPAPGTALHVIAKRIAAEFKVEPAPLPYRMQYADRPGEIITDLQDGEGGIVATLYGEEARATIEFIVRACNSHDPLTQSLLAAIKAGGMGVTRGQQWQELYESATGERP